MRISIPEIKEKIQIFVLYLKENWPEIKERVTGTNGIISSAVIFSLLFIILLILQSCTPKKGNILYGMCGEFLKMQVTFPLTITQREIEMYSNGVRIYFTHIDAFGGYQLEMTECIFRQDPQAGVQLDRVYFNYMKDITYRERVPGKGRLYQVQQKYIDIFNKSKSPAAIILNEPNLEIPEGAAVYYN